LPLFCGLAGASGWLACRILARGLFLCGLFLCDVLHRGFPPGALAAFACTGLGRAIKHATRPFGEHIEVGLTARRVVTLLDEQPLFLIAAAAHVAAHQHPATV
jgi:hypothetical protein